MRGREFFSGRKIRRGGGGKEKGGRTVHVFYSSAICERMCSMRYLMLNLFLLMLAKKMATTAHVQNILFGPFVDFFAILRIYHVHVGKSRMQKSSKQNPFSEHLLIRIFLTRKRSLIFFLFLFCRNCCHLSPSLSPSFSPQGLDSQSPFNQTSQRKLLLHAAALWNCRG